MTDLVLNSDSQTLTLPITPPTGRTGVARRIGLCRRPIHGRRYTALMIEINRVFEENFRAHGARRVWRQLDREGIAVDRYTVAKLMRMMGLQSGVRSADTETTSPEQPADHLENGHPKSSLNHSETEPVVAPAGNVYNLFQPELKMVSGRRRWKRISA